MPLFEFGAARQLEGNAPTTEAGNESDRIAQVIEDNLDGLIGEQVFRVVRADSPDQPYLIALDPSGAPVVVEVVQTLDSATLIRALDHAGAAGRMTRGQLAGQYPGGTQAFLHHLAAFMDSVPVKRARMPRSGSRLIIICEHSDDEVLNAIDYLRQPGLPFEVLRLNLVNALGGRQFVDLSPLAINPYSAPDHPLLVGSRPDATRSLEEPLPRDAVQQTQASPDAGTALPRDAAQKVQSGPDAEPSAKGPARPQDAVQNTEPRRRNDLRAALAAAQRAVARAESVIASGIAEPAPGRADAAAPTTTPVLETRRQRRERWAAERAAEIAAKRAAAQRDAAAPDSEPTLVIADLPIALSGSDVGGAHAEHLATGLQSGAPLPHDWQPHAMPAGLTIDGVLAAGIDASDPLSWDTAQLPIVVPPMASGPVRQVPTVSDDVPTQLDVLGTSAPLAVVPTAPEASGLRAAAPAPAARPTVRRTPISEFPASRPVPVVGAPPSAKISGPIWSPLSVNRSGRAASAAETAEPTDSSRGRHSMPGRVASEGGMTPIDDRPDEDLVALAGRFGEPTALVWERPRRRQRFTATLDPFGTMHVNGVGYFHNPDAAARAAAGSQFADGWTVWRVGDANGPTLREALLVN